MSQVKITVKISFNNFTFKSFLIEVELEISIELLWQEPAREGENDWVVWIIYEVRWTDLGHNSSRLNGLWENGLCDLLTLNFKAGSRIVQILEMF